MAAWGLEPPQFQLSSDLLMFYGPHGGPAITPGSGHHVSASSPQFPYVPSDAVEWDVGSLSCHSEVLRSPLRMSLGGWGGH